MANTQSWTPEAVAKRFEEAVDTLNRLPPALYLGYARYWPESLIRVRECIEAPKQKNIPPSPDAITRLEHALEWIIWVSEYERNLIWLRAAHVPWKLIAYEFNKGRTTVTYHWKGSLNAIVRRLNQQKNKTHV